MNITFLDEMMTTLLTMSRIKNYVIQQEEKDFNLRPQLHILIVSPFGTGKTSITKNLISLFGDKIISVTDFTRPAIEGSISKYGDYIPPLLIKLGGKILVIDEWNSVNYFGRQSLLGILENQRIYRVLGFKVKTPYTYIDKKGYGHVKIKDNIILGEIKFSCIAYAMEFKILDQKDKALLSRFSPIFMDITREFMEELTKGEFKINMFDYGGNINKIIITKECYSDFHKAYWEYAKKEQLTPFDTSEEGYLTRILHDVLKMGIMNYLRNNEPLRKQKEVIISYSSYLKEMIKWTTTLFNQYCMPLTNTKIYMYFRLKEKAPFLSTKEYADRLGVTERSIFRYEKARKEQQKKGVTEETIKDE